MRKFLTLCLLTMVYTSIFAGPIDDNMAIKKAKQFVASNMMVKNAKLRLAYQTHENSNKGNVYVYNIGQRQGYVIVSGDDDADNVIGYVDEGEFSMQELPDNMKAWLEFHENLIKARQEKVMASEEKAFHPTVVIQPLIKTKWGQRTPYNSACPKVYGLQTPTGCTATALAQVMKYHEFPTEACKPLPAYTTRTAQIKMPELDSTTFDWNLMPDEVTVESPQESIDEVAKLMLYCGQAHNMNYNTSGSGAYSYLIPENLPKYFGYANTMHYVYRRSYSEQEWDSLLVDELSNQRPVIYTAYNNLSQGHTFICDGYDGQGLYHINWGWNGVGNGYFRITTAFATEEGLNEEIKNYHLSLDQTAILGLQPDGEDDFVAPAEFYKAFTRPSLKMGREYTRVSVDSAFTGITFKQSFVNTSAASKRLSYGMALCDEQGQVLTVLGNASANVAAGAAKAYELKDLSIGEGLPDGHYTIKAVYKRNSKSAWQPMGGTDRNYIDMTIEGLDLTLIPVPNADFKVNNIRQDVKNFTIIEMENTGQEFYGPVYIRRYNEATGKTAQVAYDYMSFDPDSQQKLEIYVEPTKKFDIYNDVFFLSVDEYDTQYFYSSSTDAGAVIEKSLKVLNLDEADENTAVGDRVMLRLSVTNKGTSAYNNYVNTELVDQDGTVRYSIEEIVELLPGQSREIVYEIPIEDYEQTYMLRAFHRKNLYTWEEDSITGLKVAEGAIYWVKDGSIHTLAKEKNLKVPDDALAINVRGAYTSKVTPNSNPNTIYMIGTKMVNGLTGKNYVNASNRGTQLSFTDSCDYYIPCELTITGNVTYVRHIADDDSLRWDAITLPFAPDAVTADSDTIAWYASDDDTEGNFWLMSFDGIDNDTITTSHAKEMEANVPYLIATTPQLAGKDISFVASKVTLAPTDMSARRVEKGDTILQGTYCSTDAYGQWTLEDGEFVRCDEQKDVLAFRALLLVDSEETTMPDTMAIAPKIRHDEVIPMPEPPTLLGDVNGDELVNIADVVTLINYIMGETMSVFMENNADLDGNGLYSVADVVSLINIIVNAEGGQNEENAENAENEP